MPLAVEDALFVETSAVAAFDGLKKYFRVPGFRIGGSYDLDRPDSYEFGGEGGVTLESMGLEAAQIGYIELGTPHLGPDGEIDNAILICPYYSGDATNMLDFWGEDGTRTAFSKGVYLGPGRLFDTSRYYVIVADALGLWSGSRPGASHPGCAESRALGMEFPQYRLEDCVQLMYRLLRDHLGIRRLKLVTGVSMGATLSYVWGVMHPDFMEALLAIGGTTFQSRGMARWQFDLMTSAIQSDPVYRRTRGDYYHLPLLERPVMGNMFGWSIIRQSAFVDERRVEQPYDQYVLEAFDWEASLEAVRTRGQSPSFSQGLFQVSLIDSNDLIYRNRAQGMLDVEGELHRIRARTLIVHVETDQWLRPHIARRAQERIKGSRLLTFADDLGHYAVFRAPDRFRDEIGAFIEDRSGKPAARRSSVAVTLRPRRGAGEDAASLAEREV